MTRFCLILPCLLAAAAPAAAQDSSDAQLWTTVRASHSVAPRATATVELGLRFGDTAGGLYERLPGAALAYRIDDKVTASFAYTHLITDSASGPDRTEARWRQQVDIALGNAGPVALALRGRLEERQRNDGQDVGFRLRPRLAATLPLGAEAAPRALATLEGFFDLNDTDWGQNAGFRRTRAFIGIALPLAPALRIETGYLNQYDHASRTRGDRMLHILPITLSARF